MSGFSRRTFLTITSRLAALAVAGGDRLAAAAAAAGASERDRLSAAFLDPPLSARPKTRWWWFGGAVTPEEVTRELTFMRDAGIGGAEIQPLYPLSPDDPARGIRNQLYFTEGFLDVLRHAVRESRRLGLQLDFTLGSGWPYGGPFIPTGLSARRLRMLAHDLAGPREFSWLLAPHLTGDDRLVAIVAAPVGAGRAAGPLARAGAAHAATSTVRRRADAAVAGARWAVAPAGRRGLAHRSAGQASDAGHGRPGPRPPRRRRDAALPEVGRRPRHGCAARRGRSALPFRLLRQPRGVRRGLDAQPSRGVPGAPRLRPGAVAARPLAGRGRRPPRTCASTITRRCPS